MARVLLDAGASTGVVNKRGLTPLGEALAGGHVEAGRQLVDVGRADIRLRCSGCGCRGSCYWGCLGANGGRGAMGQPACVRAVPA